VSQSSPTELASGPVKNADRLRGSLATPTGSPVVILIKWPPRPSVVESVKRSRQPQRSSRYWAKRRLS
jgi:hypothetical protein